MATKKFSQMTTKKLNALLVTASDEDKKAIEAVLAAREQTQVSVSGETQSEVANSVQEFEDTENPLTPEEEAAIKAAEENGGINPMSNSSKATQEKKPKMTDEDRHALAEELKKNVNRRCQAVPFNTAEWVDGYIAGVIEEKRSNRYSMQSRQTTDAASLKYMTAILFVFWTKLLSRRKKPALAKQKTRQTKLNGHRKQLPKRLTKLSAT